jgi:hypothetical protein
MLVIALAVGVRAAQLRGPDPVGRRRRSMNEDNPEASVPGGPAEPIERRRLPRADSLDGVVGRARLLPHVSHHYPSLRPNGWYRVIRHNPEAIDPRARQGYVWIDVDGRLRQVWAAHFELQG